MERTDYKQRMQCHIHKTNDNCDVLFNVTDSVRALRDEAYSFKLIKEFISNEITLQYRVFLFLINI